MQGKYDDVDKSPELRASRPMVMVDDMRVEVVECRYLCCRETKNQCFHPGLRARASVVAAT